MSGPSPALTGGDGGMVLGGAAGGSGWTRWLGLFGAIALAVGLLTAYAGALRADISSNWEYCGALTTSLAVPCSCPTRDTQTIWPGDEVVCFTPAPDSAYAMADVGTVAVIGGALMLTVGNLLRLRRAGWAWLVIRSVLTGVASLFVAGVAVLLAAPPPCLDCPSAPSDPGLAGAATLTGFAAVVVLAAAVVPPG